MKNFLNQNFIKLVNLLGDGQFHDGPSIGNQLNITRAAVWKGIKKLEQYAIPFASSKGAGYRLDSPLILLDPGKIKFVKRAMEIVVLEKTGSTNEFLKNFDKKNRKIKVCLAETQTHAKGRLGRQWYSPFGKNIYLSILYPFEKDISELSGLSLIAGMAVAESMEISAGLPKNILKIKWPNDIFYGHEKMAGVLIETRAECNGFCEAIIGIGINVNMTKCSKRNIRQPWTSLTRITQQYHDRNNLCTTLIATLTDYLEQFSSKGLSVFMNKWAKRDFLCDRYISISSGNKEYQGRCAGIDKHGYLLIEAKKQQVQRFSSGDSTLLK